MKTCKGCKKFKIRNVGDLHRCRICSAIICRFCSEFTSDILALHFKICMTCVQKLQLNLSDEKRDTFNIYHYYKSIISNSSHLPIVVLDIIFGYKFNEYGYDETVQRVDNNRWLQFRRTNRKPNNTWSRRKQRKRPQTQNKPKAPVMR